MLARERTQISDEDDDDDDDGKVGKCVVHPSVLLQSPSDQEGSYCFTNSGAIVLSGFDAPIPQSGLASAAAAAEQQEVRDLVAMLNGSSTIDGTSGGSYCRGGVVTPMQDRIVLLGKIGEGATSVVYRAFDLLELRLVAVKVIPVHDSCKRRQLVRELSSLYDGLKARRRRTKSISTPADSSRAIPGSCATRHCSWPVETVTRTMPPDVLMGLDNLLDFIDVFVSKEASTLSLVVEYMDGGSLQVRFRSQRKVPPCRPPRLA